MNEKAQNVLRRIINGKETWSIEECREALYELKDVQSAQSKPELREKLAQLAHEQWSGWMKHLFGKCIYPVFHHPLCMKVPEGLCVIPDWAKERWQRQMNTDYDNLSEKEKDSDRAEADRFLVVFQDESKPESRLVEQSNSGPDNLPDIDSFNEGTGKPGKSEPGRCKHSMNDLMTKAGIASTCPICMQDIIDRQAEQLKDKHTISKEDAEFLRGVSSEIIDLKVQLAAKDKAHREEIFRLNDRCVEMRRAKAKEIERLKDFYKEILTWTGPNIEAIAGDNKTTLVGRLRGIYRVVEQALKAKEGTEDGSRPDATEKI